MTLIDRNYINGLFQTIHGTESLDIVDPAQRRVIGQVRLGDAEDVDRAVAAAKRAFRDYSRSSTVQRGQYLLAIHDAILARADEHVAARTLEYGGVARHNKFSIEGAAKLFLNMKRTLDQVPFRRKMGEAEVFGRAVGVAALITPWNSALFAICNKLAPALAAGCTVVIKPSELSPLQTDLLAQCIDAAGLPPGVVNIVQGAGAVAGEALCTHRDVAKVSFTGSTAIGKHIMRQAAETMKRVTLELGGKSAHLILEDADLAKAVPFALEACFRNNGQACIAGSRLLVPLARKEEIEAALAREVEKWVVGRPEDPATQLGPLVSEKQYQRVQDYIRQGSAEGARLLAGGVGQPKGLEDGNFVKPTIFVDVTNDMAIAREEIFGPVLSVLTYRTEEEAIAIANDSIYGLQGWISTGDPAHGRAVADRIEAGIVMVNRTFDLLDEAGAPAGGFKQSGIGRELGLHGIEAYLEWQSVFS